MILQLIFLDHLVVQLGFLIQLECLRLVFLAFLAIAELRHVSVDVCLHFLEEDQGGHLSCGFDAGFDDLKLTLPFGDQIL